MTHRLALVLALLASSLGAAGCVSELGLPEGADGAEPEYNEQLTTDALSSFSCAERSDTGYVRGTPRPITVVTVDGKPVERNTANAYYLMAQAAQRDGVQLRVVSGFRTNAEQQRLYSCYRNCNCNGCNLAARPGTSNHQSGLALDLNHRGPGVSRWLQANGARFGFRATVSGEPWHWEWRGGEAGGGPCSPTPPRPLVDHANPRGCGQLASGGILDPGEGIRSCDGRFQLVHQADGNVVVYHGSNPVWSSGTHGTQTFMLVMQGDANLVLYDRWNRPVWASGTGGGGARLALQDDGNAVIYRGGTPLWATHTGGVAPAAPAPAPEPPAPPPPPAPPEPAPTEPPPPAGCGALGSGASLRLGQQVASCDGRQVLVHQGDGNVVLYRDGRALWATGTHGRSTSQVVMQGDGNLVLYDAAGRAAWASGTHGHAGAALAVQDDANLVIYAPGGRAVWATGTNR